jgi:hypothetical protein
MVEVWRSVNACAWKLICCRRCSGTIKSTTTRKTASNQLASSYLGLSLSFRKDRTGAGRGQEVKCERHCTKY